MTSRHLTFGALAGVVSPVAASSTGPSIPFDAKAELRALFQTGHPALAPELNTALKNLRQEQDPEIFWSDFLSLAIEGKSQKHPESALWLLTHLQEGHPGFPVGMQHRAKQEFEAMIGGNHLGRRLEFLASRLPQEATDYRMIVPMIGGSLVGRVFQTGILGHFAITSGVSWYSRGFAARFLAGLGGYLAEVPTFTAMVRGLRPDSPSGSSTLLSDLAHSALTLGMLRSFHYLGNQTFFQVYAISETALGLPLSRGVALNRWLLPQAFSYGGLMAAHGVWTSIHPQDQGPTSNPWVDNLAMLFSLGLGTHLGHRLLGSKFHALHQELGIRTQIFTQQTQSRTLQTFYPTAMAMAMAGGYGKGGGGLPPMGLGLEPRAHRVEPKAKAESSIPDKGVATQQTASSFKTQGLIHELQTLDASLQTHRQKATPEVLQKLARYLQHEDNGVSIASATALKNIILNGMGVRLTPAFEAFFATFPKASPPLQAALLKHLCHIARDATSRLTLRRLEKIFQIMDPTKMTAAEGSIREFLNHLMVLGNRHQARWAQELMTEHGLASEDPKVQQDTLRLMEESISYLAPRLNPRTVQQLIRLADKTSDAGVAQDALQIYYYLAHHFPEQVHQDHLNNLFSIATHHGDMETRKYALATLVAADQVPSQKMVPELLKDLAGQILRENAGVARERLIETMAGLALGQYEIPPEVFSRVLHTGLFHTNNETILDASILLEKIIALNPGKLTPQMGRKILAQSLQSPNPLSQRAAARLLDRGGFPVGEHLTQPDFNLLLEQLKQTSDGDRIYGAAVLLGAATATGPHQAMARGLFQHLGLKAIEFGDSGDGLSTTSLFMGAHLREPQAHPLTSTSFPGRASLVKIPTGELPGLLSKWGTVGEPKTFGRTQVYALKDSTELLALKFKHYDQSEQELSREIHWLDAVEKSGLVLKSELPKIYRDEMGQPLMLKLSRKKNAIPLRVPARYYRYLDTHTGEDAAFMSGLTRSIYDAFLLARRGWFHTVPIRLFHNLEQPQQLRYTDDQGRFVWMPDLTFFHTSRMGMGRLSHWPSALKFGNYGLTGLRDFEEMATFSEILQNPGKWVPELKQMEGRHNFPALTEAYLMGNHLLAATLFAGHRWGKTGNQSFGQNQVSPHETPATNLPIKLQQIYASAHAAKWDLPLQVSQYFLQDKVHWNRFAKQIEFFMTPTHADYLYEGGNPKEFPVSDIYGTGVKVSGAQQKTFGPYRDQSFSLEHGFITADGDPNGLSLGAVNGQFPIREFEQAFWSIYFRP